MTFLCYLFKGKWAISISKDSERRYMLEYSDDGFGSKERRVYNSREELLKVLNRKFSPTDLDIFITKDAQIE